MAEIDGIFLKVGVDTSEFDGLDKKVKATLDQIVEDAKKTGQAVDQALNDASASIVDGLKKQEEMLRNSLDSAYNDYLQAQKDGNEELVKQTETRLDEINQQIEGIQRMKVEVEDYKNTLLQANDVPLESNADAIEETADSMNELKDATDSMGKSNDNLKDKIDKGKKAFSLFQKILRMLGITKKNDVISSKAQAIANKALAESTNATTTATYGLRAALMSMGIGLITTAVSLLVKYWDDIVAVFQKVTGLGDEVGETFETIKSSIKGIGNVIYKSAIAPFKAMASVYSNLMKGEFKKAFEEGVGAIADGYNMVNNYTEAFNESQTKYAKERAKEIAKENEKALQDYIDMQEAKLGSDWKYGAEGQKIYSQMFKERKAQYEEDSEEYREAVLDKMRYDREWSEHFDKQLKEIGDKIKKRQEAERKAWEQRKKENEKYVQDVAKAKAKAEDELAKYSIDAMEEGLDKQLAVLEENHRKKMRANELNLEKEIAQVREHYKKQGRAISEANILNEAKDNIKYDALNDAEQKNFTNNVAKLYDKALDEWQNYLEQRNAINEKYSLKEAEVNASAQAKYDTGSEEYFQATNSALEEIEKKRREELQALDERMAQASSEYTAVIQEIALVGALEMEKQLKELEAKAVQVGWDNISEKERVKITALRAEITKLVKEFGSLDRANAYTTKKDKFDAIQKSLKTTTKAIDVAMDGLEGFSDEWSDTAKKALQATKSIYSTVKSLIQSIIDIGMASLEATKTASVQTANAIKQAERSSVILAIIQAALEVAQAMFNLFKHESDVTEEVVNQHNAEIGAIDALIDKQEELIDSRKKYTTQLKELYEEEARYLQLKQDADAGWLERLASSGARQSGDHSLNYYLDKGGKNLGIKENQRDLVAKLGQQAYDRLKKASEYGLQEIGKEIANWSEMDLLRLQASKWWNSLKSYEEKVTDTIVEMNEAKRKASELDAETLESVRGWNEDDLRDDMLSYFQDVSKTIDDINTSFDDLVKNVVSRQILGKLDGKILGIVNQFDDMLKDEILDENDKEQALELRKTMQETIRKGQEEAKAIYEALGIELESERDSATARGIATASQESVDENNARLTAIQGYTFHIGEGVRTMASNSSLILNNVILIQQATDTINTNVRDLRNDVNSMQTYGVKIMN